jgi:hypothetical protein
MSEKTFRILNKARGETVFATLNMIIPNKGYSPCAYPESSLKTNPEVMDFHSKKLIELVTEEQYEKAIAAEKEELAAKSVHVEDALEVDSPSTAELRNLAKTAQRALADLVAEIERTPSSSDSQKPSKNGGKTDRDDGPADPSDDGLDLLMNAPVGLKPQARTEEYLKTNAKERRKFLNTSRDITILRDIALFESDPKLKLVARKAAKAAEQMAESASNADAAVAP